MPTSSKKENPHVGSTTPVVFYIGRVWHEITSAGLYLGSWIWNGTYWLSLQLFSHHFTTALVTTVANVVYPIDPAYNIFLTNAIATIQSNVLATATTNWGWNIARINSAGTTFWLNMGRLFYPSLPESILLPILFPAKLNWVFYMLARSLLN